MSRARDLADLGGSADAGGITGRNLIINGSMAIDQRNGGSSLTVPSGGGYSLDRWAYYSAQASKFTIQQSTETPAGYQNSLVVTSSSAYTVGASESFSVRQYIEGQNIAHLEFGNSNAKTVTLSFWVRSSLTGSFGGVFWDGFAGTSFYPFSYTISSADTWEQKTVTIDGRQSGTWATDSTTGAAVQFALGTGSSLLGTANAWTSSAILAPTGSTDVVATSGATWHITGVQLEVGSATPFEHEDFGTTLRKCQRYYEQLGPSVNTGSSVCYSYALTSYSTSNNNQWLTIDFATTKRAAPTSLGMLNGYAFSATPTAFGYGTTGITMHRTGECIILKNTTVTSNTTVEVDCEL